MQAQYTRREALGLLGALGLGTALAGGATAGAAGKQRPNIVFIMSDDHAAHALSCYGSRVNRTPHLDRIAEEGMRFDQCLCTNGICGPSRAVILTGKYSHLNGFRTNSDQFNGAQQTFPKLLREAGYRTGMIGKWHLVSEPTGFDYWNILQGQGEYHDPVMIEMGKKRKRTGYVTDIITDCTMEFIRGRDKDTPFCVMCHHKAPHRPWVPDEKHAHLFENTPIPVPATFEDDYRNRSKAAERAEMRVARDLTPEDLKVEPPAGLSEKDLAHWKYQRYLEDYLRVVASVDENVGRLLDFLDADGLRENTLVVYTSDQGFYLGDHGWFDKRFMYEESLKMPLLMRWPGIIEAGRVNSAMVSNVDFAPTFLDCAGATVPADMQGTPFTPLLRGESPKDWRKSFYYEYFEYPAVHMVYPHCGVRTERYKLIHFQYKDEIDAWEFFDLKEDPDELHSCYDDPRYAREVETLKAELARLRKSLQVPEPA